MFSFVFIILSHAHAFAQKLRVDTKSRSALLRKLHRAIYHKRTVMRWAFTCVYGAILAVVGCNVDRSAEMEAEITRRIERERKVYSEQCRAKILQKAEEIADSLLLFDAKLKVNDSLRQKLPFKPLAPPDVAPIDTLTVKPLFEKH